MTTPRTAPTEDFPIAYARRILAETEARPDDYGDACGQRTTLRIVLSGLLAYIDERAERDAAVDAAARKPFEDLAATVAEIKREARP
jgi:diacylglycerol kinase family enzyme